MEIKHPVIYRCEDFIFYLETCEDLPFVHVKINRFSHNIFKEMKKIVHSFTEVGLAIYGYAEDKQTERLMRMAGFKETEVFVKNSNNKIGRVLCLQQQF